MSTATLDDLDDDFEKVATLPEPTGEFTWEVHDASSRHSPRTGRIVKVTYRCCAEEHGEFKHEKEYWLFKKDGDNRVPDEGVIRGFKDDLKRFGIDADKFAAAGKKWGEWLDPALKALIGLKVKAKRNKSEPNKDTGRVYVNFYLGKRVLADGEPAELSFADVEARAAAFDEANKDPFGGGDGIPE